MSNGKVSEQMAVQTGTWKDSDSLLALYRFHMNASDGELEDLGIGRDQVVALIRELEFSQDNYRQTELTTIAHQMLRAFKAGQAVK